MLLGVGLQFVGHGTAAGEHVAPTLRRPVGGEVRVVPLLPIRGELRLQPLALRSKLFDTRTRAESIAEEVGQEYGRAMAAALTGPDLVNGQRSLRSAIQAVADALTAHGFAAHAEKRNDQLRIINNHCPFGDVAMENPVVCAVDRGMVKGMLAALYGDADVSIGASLPQGDSFCSTIV